MATSEAQRDGAPRGATTAKKPPSKNDPFARDDREIEIMQAEMEVRMRQFVVDLVHPTIRRTSQLEMVFQELQAVVATTDDKLAELRRIGTRVEQQVSLVETFREEMGKWDVDRRSFQADCQEQISSMRSDMDVLRYQLERGDASLHSVQRTVDRVAGELGRVQDNSEQLRQYAEHRLSQTTKLLNNTKSELETKLVDLETRFNRANDEIWGEETGLAKVIAGLKSTNRTLANVDEIVKGMQYTQATSSQLQEVQSEVNALMAEANTTITVLKTSVDTSLADLKAHFKTATNTVAAHNAAMLSEVRNSYQEELKESAQTRSDVMDFMKISKEDVRRIEETLTESKVQTEAALKNMEKQVNEVGNVRKRDKNNTDVETMSMKEQLHQVTGSSQEVAKSLEHLSSVIWMLVQSDNAAAALDIQDDVDRGKVALMGYKDPKSKATGAKQLSGRSSSNPQSPEEPQAGPVLSVDNRCLSCSGQSATVLSGFKMACLQYAPGPVQFARKAWNRGELLEWRTRLLNQAHDALQSGPIEFHKDVAGPRPRSGLSGGMDQVHGLPARAGTAPGCDRGRDTPNRPESRTSTGSHQSQSARMMPPIGQRSALSR